MRIRSIPWVVVIGAVAAGLWLPTQPIAAQAPASPTRTADGKPNLSGIWQAMNEANWDIQAHVASAGPVSALGGAYAVPPGLGVVEGGEIPYQPAAAEQKKKNFANRLTLDPEIKCYLPGVPRGDVHALSVPDYPKPETHHDGVRVCRRPPHHLHG